MRTRALAVENNILYVQYGQLLVALDTSEGDKILWCEKLPFTSSVEHSRLLARLLRLGIHFLMPLDDGALALVIRKRLLRYEPSGQRIETLCEEFKGTRPLFLCRDHEGHLYFGEYFDNPHRIPVNIYRSDYGKKPFRVVHTFGPGVVRHVHGVFSDPYSRMLYVTTGDTNPESAIWCTDDQFRHLHKITSGGQRTRVVQLLFEPDHIYFGTDTPLETNYICRIEKKTHRVERIQSVGNSVFYGCKSGGHLFFSTVVEPSDVNTEPFASLWGSQDGTQWRCILRLRKDSMAKKWFQYGQILFPSGENSARRLWFTPMATEFDQSLMWLDLVSGICHKLTLQPSGKARNRCV